MTSGIPSFGRHVAIVLLTLWSGIVACGQASRPQHAHLSLVFEQAALAPGSQWIGLRFQLDSGWHIYWTNPGDSGEPPKVSWHLPAGAQVADLQFPAPHRIEDHGLTDYGYEGEVVLLSRLTMPAVAASNKAEIGADVRYLVCREVCIPGKDHVSVSLPVDQNGKPSADVELVRRMRARLPQSLPPGARVSAELRSDKVLITVAGKAIKPAEIKDFIPADAQIIENSTKPVMAFSGAARQIQMKKSEQLDSPPGRLRGLLITQDKAYNVDVPLTAAKKTSQTTSAPKPTKE